MQARRRCFLLALYGIAVARWLAYFLDPRARALLGERVLDWHIAEGWYGVWRHAVHAWQVPLFSAYIHYTDRFLGSPETPLSPQHGLAALLSFRTFVATNFVILYTLGFWGLVLLRRRLDLGYGGFGLLWALFSFNGYITAHMAAGHVMWWGYWLLPFFFFGLVDMSDEARHTRGMLVVALSLASIWLQGSFLIVVWASMFLVLVAIAHERYRWGVVRALLWTAGLTAFRWMPAWVVLRHWDQPQMPGYDLGRFAEALLLTPDPPSDRGRYLTLGIAWWEYDAFVGIAGAILIASGVAALYLPAKRAPAPRLWLLPALGLVVLAWDGVWRTLALIPMSLIQSQRVPSRFVVIALVAVIVAGSLGLDRILRRYAQHGWRRWAAGAVLLVLFGAMALELEAHLRLWALHNVESWFPDHVSTGPIDVAALPIPHQRGAYAYLAALVLGTAISLRTLARYIPAWRQSEP